MAEEEKKEPEQPEAAPPPKAPMTRKKKLTIFGAIFVVQLVAVITLGHVLIKPRLAPADTTAAASADPARGTIVMLDDITVNLESDRRSRFLRLKIGLELQSEEAILELEARKPEVRDVVITSVSGRPAEQLITVEGKEQLKRELRERINGKLQKGDLLNVYFSDFVVQ